KNKPKGYGIGMAAADAGIQVVALNVWAAAEVGSAQLNLLPRFTDSLLELISWGPRIVYFTITMAVWAWQISHAGPGNAGGGPAEETGVKTHNSDTSYTVCAPCITLVSAPTAINEDDPVGIVIQANGLEGTDGEVLVLGTGKATLIGGAQAVVQCVT